MSLADDPRLTAYADGALPRHDSLRLERELAGDAAALAELAELRELQRGLREAFADNTPAPAAVSTPPAARGRSSGAGPASRLVAWIGIVFVTFGVVIVGATLLSTGGRSRMSSDRAAAVANLHQIGQACLIYAAGHREKFPEASDIWDFASQLALEAGLGDANIWTIETDPAAKDDRDLTAVLAADRRTLHPEFAVAKPAYAVVLGGVSGSSPAATPIAWTRGLRADGTWAPESPFGAKGGHVLFLSGEVRFFFSGPAEFVGRDGLPTKNVHDALPAGSRVGEYVPTPAEARLWSEQARPLPRSVLRERVAHATFFSAAALVLAGACVWQIVRRRFRVGELLMASLVSLLLVMLGAAMR